MCVTDGINRNADAFSWHIIPMVYVGWTSRSITGRVVSPLANCIRSKSLEKLLAGLDDWASAARGLRSENFKHTNPEESNSELGKPS